MASCYERTRTLADGSKRFDVKYRRGGRGARLQHGGTFRTAEQAQRHANYVRDLLAFGLDPSEVDAADALRDLEGPDPVRPLLVLSSAIAAADRAGDHALARSLAVAVLRHDRGCELEGGREDG